MNRSRTIFWVLAALALPIAACGGGKHTHSEEAATASDVGPQVVELSVTAEGFMPKEWTVESGRPVKLVVTRTIENTCATDFVIKDYGINRPLPLNEAVEIEFTPTATGRVRYACAHDMLAGVLIVG